MKLFRILGKRGRTTIPYAIRQRIGFAYNDVLSFEENGDSVIIRREKVCDHCKSEVRKENLLDFLEELSAEEQRTALVHLSVLLAQRQEVAK